MRAGWMVTCGALLWACGGGHAATTVTPHPQVVEAPVAIPDAPPPPPAVVLIGCAPTSAMPQRFDTTMGGLEGNEAGEMQGGFGYGKVGSGEGGGGVGWGTIGTGKYGTIGHGKGSGTGYGIGGGRGGAIGYQTAAPSFVIDPPKVKGHLDKAIVRRYLKRNQPKFQYCYEKQLLADPGISGIAESELEIGADGKVSRSRARGIDPLVAACIANYAAAIEFPKPKGGGTVDVSVRMKAWWTKKQKKALRAPKADDAWIEAGATAQTSAQEDELAVPPPATPGPWSPYASRLDPVDDSAVRTVEAAINDHLADLSACFTGSNAPTGSMRAMVRTDGSGAVVSAQVGGLGDPAIESCVASVLAPAGASPVGAADLACDLTRGDAQPWRMTRDGYDHVVDVSASGLQLDGQDVTPGPDDRASIGGELVLVVGDASATGAQLERALTWAGEGRRAVVAIQRDEALVYLSALDLTPQPSYSMRPGGPRPSITVRDGQATACIAKTTTPGADASDAAALDQLLAQIDGACAQCERTIEIVLADDAPLEAALAPLAAARRAGFDALLAAHPSDVDCQ